VPGRLLAHGPVGVGQGPAQRRDGVLALQVAQALDGRAPGGRVIGLEPCGQLFEDAALGAQRPQDRGRLLPDRVIAVRQGVAEVVRPRSLAGADLLDRLGGQLAHLAVGVLEHLPIHGRTW
jgi:hypothetical protein